MQFLGIVFMSIVAFVFYGVVHDQATVRLAEEYFLIGYAPIFKTRDPVIMALGWGVVEAWWLGPLIGASLATAARAGNRPKLRASFFVRPIAALILFVASFAFVGGAIAYAGASLGFLDLPYTIALLVPEDRQPRYLAAVCAHFARYASIVIGGVTLVWWTWRIRAKAEAWYSEA